MKRKAFFAVGMMLSWCCLSTVSAVRNVPSQYSTIQAAIDASVNGDTVVIAAGTYTGNGNQDIYFYGKAITVRGATGNPRDCTIDSNGTSVTSHNGFNFIYGEGGGSILEAITITRGCTSNSYVGAGIHIDSSSPVINNCIIRNNWATEGCGGGILNMYGSPKINRCIISNNSAGWGAGIFNLGGSAVISNCAILNNSGTIGCGSAIYNSNNSNSITKNCTIRGNVMSRESIICNAYNGSGRPTMTNCIMWGNTTAVLIHGFITVTYCDMQYGYAGTGNINKNPLFEAGGYGLSASSPCINSGDPGYVADGNEIDLAGLPRVLYGRIDMGVCEFTAATGVIGDIDSDGDIDYDDFVLFKNAFASSAGGTGYLFRADLDTDGRVTFVDYQKWLVLYNAAHPLNVMSMNTAELIVEGDFDSDLDVDTADFAVFAQTFDDGSAGPFADLQLIGEHWLECWRLDCPESVPTSEQ